MFQYHALFAMALKDVETLSDDGVGGTPKQDPKPKTESSSSKRKADDSDADLPVMKRPSALRPTKTTSPKEPPAAESPSKKPATAKTAGAKKPGAKPKPEPKAKSKGSKEKVYVSKGFYKRDNTWEFKVNHKQVLKVFRQQRVSQRLLILKSVNI